MSTITVVGDGLPDVPRIANIQIVGEVLPGVPPKPNYVAAIRDLCQGFGYSYAMIIPGLVRYRYVSTQISDKVAKYKLEVSVPDNAVLVKLSRNADQWVNRYAYIPTDNGGNLDITPQGPVVVDEEAKELILDTTSFPQLSDVARDKEWLKRICIAIGRNHHYISGRILPTTQASIWVQQTAGYPARAQMFPSLGYYTVLFQNQARLWQPVYISSSDIQPSTQYQLGTAEHIEAPQLDASGGGTITPINRYYLEALGRNLQCNYMQVWLGAPWDYRNIQLAPNLIAENLNYLYETTPYKFGPANAYNNQAYAEWPTDVEMKLRFPTSSTKEFWPKGAWENSWTIQKVDQGSNFYLACMSPRPDSPKDEWLQAVVPVDKQGDVNTNILKWIPVNNNPFLAVECGWGPSLTPNIRISQIVAAVARSANMTSAYIRSEVHGTTKYSRETIKARGLVGTNNTYGPDPYGLHVTVFFMNRTDYPTSFFPAHIYVDNNISLNFKSVVWFYPTSADLDRVASANYDQ